MNKNLEAARTSLAALTADEAINLAIATLHAHRARCKIWLAEDLESEIESSGYDVTDEQKQRIVEAAQEIYYWRGLDECTDQNWEHVSSAVQEAAKTLGIELY